MDPLYIAIISIIVSSAAISHFKPKEFYKTYIGERVIHDDAGTPIRSKQYITELKSTNDTLVPAWFFVIMTGVIGYLLSLI